MAAKFPYKLSWFSTIIMAALWMYCTSWKTVSQLILNLKKRSLQEARANNNKNNTWVKIIYFEYVTHCMNFLNIKKIIKITLSLLDCLHVLLTCIVFTSGCFSHYILGNGESSLADCADSSTAQSKACNPSGAIEERTGFQCRSCSSNHHRECEVFGQ